MYHFQVRNFIHTLIPQFFCLFPPVISSLLNKVYVSQGLCYVTLKRAALEVRVFRKQETKIDL